MSRVWPYDPPLRDRLGDISTSHPRRFTVNRWSHEVNVDLGGDNNQASNFEKLVSTVAFEPRIADSVRVDQTLEKNLRRTALFASPLPVPPFFGTVEMRSKRRNIAASTRCAELQQRG